MGLFPGQPSLTRKTIDDDSNVQIRVFVAFTPYPGPEKVWAHAVARRGEVSPREQDVRAASGAGRFLGLEYTPFAELVVSWV